MDINAASGAVIDLAEIPFLLTAGHVMERAIERLTSEPSGHFLAADVEVQIDPSRVRVSREIDIATAPLSPAVLERLQANGHHIVRPPAWPPPLLQREDAIALGGFPGAWRRRVAWDEMEFGGFTMTALVHDVQENEFVCYIDPAYLEEHHAPGDEPLPLTLPGLSGAPAFLARPTAVLAPQLCGTVKEGVDLGSRSVVIRYARLDRLGRNGEIN